MHMFVSGIYPAVKASFYTAVSGFGLIQCTLLSSTYFLNEVVAA